MLITIEQYDTYNGQLVFITYADDNKFNLQKGTCYGFQQRKNYYLAIICGVNQRIKEKWQINIR